jgi:hypothetical protein
MKKLAISVLVLLAMTIAQSTVVTNSLSKDIAWRIEEIQIQTLTISDQQFLNGDLSEKPTTIARPLGGQRANKSDPRNERGRRDIAQ